MRTFPLLILLLFFPLIGSSTTPTIRKKIVIKPQEKTINKLEQPTFWKSISQKLPNYIPSTEEFRTSIQKQPIIFVASTAALTFGTTITGYYAWTKYFHKKEKNNDPEKEEPNYLGKKIESLEGHIIQLQKNHFTCPNISKSSESDSGILQFFSILTSKIPFQDIQKKWIVKLQEHLAHLEQDLLQKNKEEWNKIVKQQPQPIGLANNGNTCYRNATLQSLHHLYPQIYHSCIEAEKNHPQLITNQIFQDFKSFARSRTFKTQKKYADLKEEFDQFEELCAGYFDNTYRQEDASELLNHLLDKEISDEQNNEKGPAQQAINSILQETLGVTTQISQKYPKNDHNPDTEPNVLASSEEKSYMLSLNFPSTNSEEKLTLTNLLKNTFGIARDMGPENLVQGQEATETTTIQLPENTKHLCITLKRFETSFQEGQIISNKITTPVTIPTTITIPNQCLTKNTNEEDTKNHQQYSLKSIVCHSGSLSGGHYTAYVQKQDKWYFCDDSSVSEEKDFVQEDGNIQEDKIASTAYILFYEKLKEESQDNLINDQA